MEEAGRIRRGYFVDGLGAAQFALPGAVDRLRALRDQPGEAAGEHGRVVHLLAAADPANPYGAALPWPRRDESDRRPLQRAAGAYVVLVDGAAAVVPRAGRGVARDPAAAPATPASSTPRSGGSAASSPTGASRELVLARIDGEPAGSSARRDALIAAGFVAGYRGLVLRPAPPAERTYPSPAPLPPVR